MLLFTEFRYRFDPKWRPEPSPNHALARYLQCARHWATGRYWSFRPWRLCNFPRPIRSESVSKCNDQDLVHGSSNDNPAFWTHQTLSAKIRTLLKAIPDILQSPSKRHQCMVLDQFPPRPPFIIDACNNPRNNNEAPSCTTGPFDFELQKRNRDYDVHLVRWGRKPKYVRAKECVRSKEGEVWKISVISFRGDRTFISRRPKSALLEIVSRHR